MKSCQVVPVASSSPTTSAVLSVGLYTVKASQDLPQIRARHMIKTAWVSPRALRRFNWFAHHYGRPLAILSAILGYLVSAILYFPGAVGRAIALTAPLVLPSITISFLGLRYDMTALLIGTFDFWYQSTMNTMSLILLTMYLADVRAVALLVCAPMDQIVFLGDAHSRGTRMFSVVSLISALICGSNGIVVFFSLVDDGHPRTFFFIGDRAVTGKAFMVNGLLLSAVIQAHNAYVHRRVATASRDDSGCHVTTVRCVLYRSRLRWYRHQTVSRMNVVRRPVQSAFNERFIRLRCHGLRQTIDAKRTLVNSPLQLQAETAARSLRASYLRWGIVVACGVGYVAIITSFALVSGGLHGDSALVHSLGVLSLAATTPVWLCFVCYVHQLDMLRLLHTSFDFLFVFIQLAFTHLCVCDLCKWDGRAMGSLASLLWLHWSMAIDAVPPIRREQLGIPIRAIATAVQIGFFVGLALLAYDLLSWHSQKFQDNLIFGCLREKGEKFADWSVGSFFVNRLPTVFLCLGRSLWRLVRYEADELIVLRGAVEYDDYELHKRRARDVHIQEITSALSQQSQQERERRIE